MDVNQVITPLRGVIVYFNYLVMKEIALCIDYVLRFWQSLMCKQRARDTQQTSSVIASRSVVLNLFWAMPN